MPLSGADELAIAQEFIDAFNFRGKVEPKQFSQVVFHQKQLIDLNASRLLVDQFVKKCERRDPAAMKSAKKRISAWMNESDQMTLMLEFIVRCRQAHIFYSGAAAEASRNSSSVDTSLTSTPTQSIQSSPFQRRSVSRGRVLSTLTGDHHHHQNPSSEPSSRSRANSSFTSYDSRNMGIERQLSGSQRRRSPFRLGTPSAMASSTSHIPTTRVSPLTSASNHLFATQHNGLNHTTNPYHFRGGIAVTPQPPTQHPTRDESPSLMHQRASNIPHHQSSHQNTHLRQTPQLNYQMSSVTTSIRSPVNSKSNTPLHSRCGNAITETESFVCECLLSALLGIETRLFTPIHRIMTITSTASLSMTHHAVCRRVLSLSNTFLLLSHKEYSNSSNGQVTAALLAAIRKLLGEYIADIDGLRRRKDLQFHQCLPLIDKWQIQLSLLAMAHKIRNMPQMELLESLYVLHSGFAFDENRRAILDKLLDYTFGVLCNQMMDWMTSGEVPSDKWMIEKDGETGELLLKKVPIFITETDAKILLEIGKSLPRVESACDKDLESIDKATTVVRAALSPKLILRKELTPVLRILRDVVCGIVMRMVVTTGRLKEHILKAASFFFLSDPRFTATLYAIIKEASLGLRVGSASLSRQTVSSALAAALEATTQNTMGKTKKKLKFTLDALTSLGSTPNVSSKMQFVQPLRPRYEPHMDLMKPIFHACNDAYETIFHVIWSIDLARFSAQEALTQNLPAIMRFLLKHYSLRENATCLLNMLSHVFCIVNSTLLRVRCHVSMQLDQFLQRFLAAIDEKCDDVDDVIREHLMFVRRSSVVVFAQDSEKIEHELVSVLRVTFEAVEFAAEFSAMWDDVIETTLSDENIRKARVAEICKKKTLGVRMLLDSVNKSQKKLNELLDDQITYGNDALID